MQRFHLLITLLLFPSDCSWRVRTMATGAPARGTGNGGRRCKASTRPPADMSTHTPRTTQNRRAVIIDRWACIFGDHLASVSSSQGLLHLLAYCDSVSWNLTPQDERTACLEWYAAASNQCKFSGLRQALVSETPCFLHTVCTWNQNKLK